MTRNQLNPAGERRRWIALPALVSLAILALTLGCSGDKPPPSFDGGITPITPIETSNTPSETPLVAIDEGFTRRNLADGESPTEAHGLIFQDVKAGSQELWTLPIAGRPESDYFVEYQVDSRHRWLLADWRRPGVRESTFVIADRTTGDSYRFASERWMLVAGPTPEGLLVAQSRGQPGAFVTVDLAANPTGIVTRFSLPVSRPSFDGPNGGEIERDGGVNQQGGQAVLLGDGRTLLIALREQGELEPGKTGPRRVFSIETGTGSVEEKMSAPSLLLRATSDGGASIAAISPTEAIGCQVDRDGNLIQRRLDLDASRLSMPETLPMLSPDGRWLAWFDVLPLREPADIGMPYNWPTVTLVDLESGAVTLESIRTTPLQWLGDSGMQLSPAQYNAVVVEASSQPDGILMETPGDAGAVRFGLAVLRVNGALKHLTIDSEAGDTAEQWPAVGHNLDFTELVVERSVRPGSDSSRPSPTRLGLTPEVQRAPFPDSVRLRVAAGGDSLNVRTAPGLTQTVLGTLPDGAIVTATNATAFEGCHRPEGNGCSVAIEPGDPHALTWWIHVASDSGLAGWVSADYLTWG